MLFKQVKEYGADKRQHIIINKSDNFPSGDVVIFTEDEYKKYKQGILDLENKIKTLQIENSKLLALNENYKNQEKNLKDIVENVTAPIHETYQEDLKAKDDKINELETKLNAVELKFNEYNLELNGLNGIEMVLLRRHKPMIKQYSATINTIIKSNKVDNNIVDADANAIPGDKQQNNKSE